MKYHILFIEPCNKPKSLFKTKPKAVVDFIKSLVYGVEKIGGKVYANHDVVMLGDYDATFVVIVDCPALYLPTSTEKVKIIALSFENEAELLENSTMKNIEGLKKGYLKNRRSNISNVTTDDL